MYMYVHACVSYAKLCTKLVGEANNDICVQITTMISTPSSLLTSALLDYFIKYCIAGKFWWE